MQSLHSFSFSYRTSRPSNYQSFRGAHFGFIEALLRACKLQDSNTSSPYPLSHLRDVELAAEYWLPGDTFADMVYAILAPPVFKTLHLCWLMDGTTSTSLSQRHISNVTHFSLPCSEINSLVFAELLKRLPRLVHLNLLHICVHAEKEKVARLRSFITARPYGMDSCHQGFS